MKSRLTPVSFFALATALFVAAPASGAVRITEFMSEGQGDIASGNGGRRQREFFELTNLGPAAVDVSSWSYNDNNVNDPNNFGPTLGSIAAGESVVFTQMSVADFRSYWSVPPSVRIVSYLQLSNLGNADTINIYNSTVTQDATTLVDSLTYTSDARGSGISRNRPFGGDGATVNADWMISSVGDSFGSFLAPSPTGFPPNFPLPTDGFDQANYIDLANPGRYAPIPEPCTLALAGVAALALRCRARRSACIA
jgi:hypothetical protein